MISTWKEYWQSHKSEIWNYLFRAILEYNTTQVSYYDKEENVYLFIRFQKMIDARNLKLTLFSDQQVSQSFEFVNKFC